MFFQTGRRTRLEAGCWTQCSLPHASHHLYQPSEDISVFRKYRNIIFPPAHDIWRHQPEDLSVPRILLLLASGLLPSKEFHKPPGRPKPSIMSHNGRPSLARLFSLQEKQKRRDCPRSHRTVSAQLGPWTWDREPFPPRHTLSVKSGS